MLGRKILSKTNGAKFWSTFEHDRLYNEHFLNLNMKYEFNKNCQIN